MIGLFDSGAGGLSVLREVQLLLPHENLIYVADQAHVPYGEKLQEQIRVWSAGISQFLISQQAKLIVAACNTASAAALDFLRQKFPDTPFVGMEPAVKPGALATKTGKVGVLATAGTFESQRYASLMARYAGNVQMMENPCVGLVELIEAGAECKPLLKDVLRPMLNAGIDTLILGCTHYPFVLPEIQAIVGEDVTIIDPSPAVAQQVKWVLSERRLLNNSGDGSVVAFTSGNAGNFPRQIQRLLGNSYPVQTLQWQKNKLNWV